MNPSQKRQDLSISDIGHADLCENEFYRYRQECRPTQTASGQPSLAASRATSARGRLHAMHITDIAGANWTDPCI